MLQDVVLYGAATLVAARVLYLLVRHYHLYVELEKIGGIPLRFPSGTAYEHTSSKTYLKSCLDEVLHRPYAFRVWMGPITGAVSVFHPTTIAAVLPAIDKGEVVYSMLHPWLGQGLLTGNGEHWRRARKALTPAFHFDILKEYAPITVQCAGVLLDKWAGHVADRPGEPLELFKDVRFVIFHSCAQLSFFVLLIQIVPPCPDCPHVLIAPMY